MQRHRWIAHGHFWGRPRLGRDHPELDELWQRFASPAVRHVATLGGNIANGSPIGDSVPALMALGARVLLPAANERRTLALEDFYLGYQRNALRPGEFIEAIELLARPSLGGMAAKPSGHRLRRQWSWARRSTRPR